jgi:hypothetical protein
MKETPMQWRGWRQLLRSLCRTRRDRFVRSWHRLPRLERLEERLPPAAHDTLATALPFPFAAGPVAGYSGALSTDNQVDLYAVSLRAGDEVAASVTAQTLGSPACCLRAFSGSGQQLAFGENTGSADTTLTFDALAGGVYYVGVSSNGNYSYDPNTTNSGSGGLTTGPYTLKLTLSSILVSQTPSNNSLRTAQPIAGTAQDGTIDGNMVLQGTHFDGAIDYYSFTASQTGGLTATVTPGAGTEFVPRLMLYGAAGQLLIQADTAASAAATAQVIQNVQPGTYYLAVSAVTSPSLTAGTQSYVLATTFTRSLPPLQTMSVGNGPESVAVADFNHDGNLDLVTANYDGNDPTDNQVSVLLGNGNGTFQSAVYYNVEQGATGIGPDCAVVGDLRNDGNLDIVTSNYGDNTVSVLLGKGDGTFGSATTYSVGNKPSAVALGYFNGRLGIVTANSNYNASTKTYGPGTVSVLLGNGDGTFQSAVSYSVGLHPDTVTVGEFNGQVDIVTGNQGDNTVSVLLGNGDGTFQSAVTYKVGSKPYDVAVADFNGLTDIVTANYGSNTVSVLLGKGDGTFQSAVSYPVGDNPAAVAMGQIAGALDIVTANAFSNSVSVLKGNGDGTFQAADSYAVGKDAFGVGLGDFRNDGNLDIATVNFKDDSVSLLLGRGDGSFLTPVTLSVGQRPFAVAVGKFNSDRNLDIATANDGANTVSVLLGNGDGTFQPSVAYPVGVNPDSVAVADLAGDGADDIITANYSSNNVSVLLGRGDGTFLPAVSYPVGDTPFSVAVRDFNGYPDIVTANYRSGTISVLLGNGDGTFQSAVSYPVGPSPRALAIANLNGHLGIVTANANYIAAKGTYGPGTVSVLLGNGDGTFQSAVAYPVGTEPLAVAVGDFNGRPDIVTANYQDDTISVLLGNVHGVFHYLNSDPKQGTFHVGTGPEGAAVGRFTSDGKFDVVVANASDNTVALLQGKGDGTFFPAVTSSVGNSPLGVAVGDFNNDGHLDLVTANLGDSTATVLLGTGSGSYQAASTFLVGSDPLAVSENNDQNTLDNIAATVSASTNTVSVLVANNPDDTSFQPPVTRSVGNDPVAVAVGTDASGYPDVVTANANYDAASGKYGPGSVSVLLGDQNDRFGPTVFSYPVGPQPDAVAVTGDQNSNLVIFTANAGDSTVSVLTQGDADAGTFLPAASYPVDTNPNDHAVPVAIAVAPDNNGNDVIVTANGSANTISVLIEHDDGNDTFFAPAVTYPVNDPTSVAVDSSNNDFVIVAASAANNSVSVFREDASAVFHPAGTYKVGNDPVAVQVNTDSENNFDIATANYKDNTVSFLPGNGNATSFQPAIAYPVGPQPDGVDLGQDSQSNLDIFVACAGNSTLSVLLGNFQFHPTTPANGIAIRNVPILQDLTGASDVHGNLIADELILDNSGHILFRQGTADPSDPFASPVTINPKNPARDVTVFRTPGGWSVAAVDELDNAVSIYTYDTRTHSFHRRAGFTTGDLPVRIVAADLNGDNLDDLVVANDFNNSITIAFQTGSGTFTGVLTRAVGAGPSDIAFASLAGSQGPDIVVSDQVSGDFSVLLNDPTATSLPSFRQENRYRAGTGLFDISIDPNTGAQTILSPLQSVGITAGDFTGSAGDDLIVLNQGDKSFTLFPSQGQGSFDPPQTGDTYFPTSGKASQIVPLTLPGDMLPGVAVLMQDLGQIWIYRNEGNGTFGQPTVVNAGNDPSGFSVASVNGQLALLVGNSYGDILTLLYDGHGNFAPDRSTLHGLPLAVGTIAATKQQFAVVADQNLDRAWLYLRVPGTTKFGRPVPITTQSYPLLAPGAVQTFTMPGDPDPYLIVANSLSNNVLVYHFDPSTGGFDLLNSIQVGDDPVSITVAYITGAVPDLLVANYGSNDVSVVIGSIGSDGLWQAQPYQRVSSGGSGPIAVAARPDPNSGHGPDLAVTNSDGRIVTLPGIGANGTGSGFFQGNHPQTVPLGVPILHAGFDVGTGNQFLVVQGGELIAADGAVLVATGVETVSATDGVLIVGLTDGAVEVMTETGANPEMQAPDFIDQPSALQALLNGNQIDVYATYQGQQAPVLFSFAVPALTELPTTSTVALASSLADTNLILTAVLLQGNLVERVEVESAPAEEAFAQLARSTVGPLLFSDAAVNDTPPAEAPQVVPGDADLPVEAPLRSFRMGVEEALRQWLRDQRPGPRIDAMLEALQGMLPALPKTLEPPPVDARSPAEQGPAEGKQPAEEQEPAEVNEQQPREDMAFQPTRTEAEVEVFAGVDMLPILVAVGWLMDQEEEDTPNPPGLSGK